MPSLYRLVVPRQVSKVIHPVNIPSPRSLITPKMPKRRPRRRRLF